MSEPGYEFEGLGRRFVAALIDNLTWLLGGFWLLSFIPESVYENDPEVVGVALFLLATAWFNYFAISEWRWGQTIGKNAMGMRVISVDRGKLSFGQASVRNLLRIVDFFVVGWVMIATSAKRQRLGDRAAGTVVVRRSPAEARNYTVAGAAPIGGGSEPVQPPAAPAAEESPAPEQDTGGRGKLPEISWNVARTVKALIGGILLAGLFAPLLVLPFDPDLDSDAAILVAQGLFGASLILVAVGVASGWDRGRVRDALGQLGLRPVGLKAFGIALLTLIGYYIVVALFATLLVNPEQEDVASELGVNDPSVLVAISAVLMIAVLAPLSEELFFRGMVFSGLRSRFSLWPAALISGVVFGLPHVLTGPLAAIPLTVLGVALAWLYERTGSLWPCIFIHMINNGLALAVTS